MQALLAMDYRPVPLAGRADEKVVDVGIQRTLDALLAHDDADVLLASHDADFAEHLGALLGGDAPSVGLIGLREFMSTQLTGARHPALRPRGRRQRLQPAAAAGADHPARRVRPRDFLR